MNILTKIYIIKNIIISIGVINQLFWMYKVQKRIKKMTKRLWRIKEENDFIIIS